MGGFFHVFALHRQPSHARREAPKCHDWRLFRQAPTACEGRGGSGPAQIVERRLATPPRLDLKVAWSDRSVPLHVLHLDHPARRAGTDGLPLLSNTRGRFGGEPSGGWGRLTAMNHSSASQEPEEVALLTGPRAASVLSAALAPAGQRLASWEVHSVHHRPGAGVSVGYTAVVVAPNGRSTTEYLCATTARLSNPHAPGLTRVAPTGGDGPAVHVWRHPADPELPGLVVACTPSLLSARIGTQVKATMVAYRPTRRAVVRATFPDETTAYAKVLRPSQAPSFAQRHRLLTASGVPAPEVLREDPDGLVLLSTGRGVALSGLLSQGMSVSRSERVFNGLISLLDALPASAMQLPAHAAWSERARHYAHAAATVLPEHAARARAVAEGVEQLMAASDAGRPVPVHGDFYEANVLMEGESVTSLLDVDSLGPGYRVDDLACLLGHVSVLDHLAPASYPKLRPILETWTRMAERQVDPVSLRARCAGVVLSLVAGARREDGGPWRPDAEGRLARAETWLAQGREIQARRGAH